MLEQPSLVHFAEQIRKLPTDIADNDLLPFLLEQDTARGLKIYYAPFEWVNERAAVVICGITPGRSSMIKALVEAQTALQQGATLVEAGHRSRVTASFSNMRPTLARWLDQIGVDVALRLESCNELFSTRRDLLHTTSCVRYPVMKDGRNYNGHRPKLTRSPIFREYITSYLADEVRLLPNALFVPNGNVVAEALEMAGVNEKNLLIGFPHASRSAAENPIDIANVPAILHDFGLWPSKKAPLYLC